MTRLFENLAIAAVAAGVVCAPLSAEATRGMKSWQGNDDSYDYKLSYKIRIRDGEDDGRSVRVEYKTEKNGTSRHLYNYNGVNTSKHESLRTYPRAHRAIEVINDRPDAYGAWKYPS